MESSINIILIATAVLQLIMIITFFVVASNIASIKNKISLSRDNFTSKFYSLILDEKKEDARSILYDQISKESCFISAANSPEKYLIDHASKELESKYKRELKSLGMETLDLQRLMR